MEYVMMAINESWPWLGPWLIGCLAIMCIASAVEVIRESKD